MDEVKEYEAEWKRILSKIFITTLCIQSNQVHVLLYYNSPSLLDVLLLDE
ncbi:hypothetical protein PHMEG_00014498 [Phytophthora megakarya]|uniref:Uncharacterized protein n=1 Tax=Phytophthora megakarya TaxID=4795 RepID=A0A225W3T5_9STRA|nr:hypothetical protein PHMEG_00014498 [Phytophthora megakarya]